VVAAAERRVERALAVRSAQEALEFRGSTLPADDLSLVDALTEEYRRTVLLVRHFHGVVSALEEDASGGRLAPVWELYRAERAHLAQLAVAMARLGLEERRVAIDEALADDLVATMDAAFDALGLTVEQRLVAVEAMARARAGRG
jgi:hypothetical protein